MAIQPISSAIFSNRTSNNVNFEGKSKEVKKHSTIKSTAMAVPLATLIAMSPLSMSAAERNSVFGEKNAAKIEMAEAKAADDSIKWQKNKDGVIVGIIEKDDYYTIRLFSDAKDNKFQSATVQCKSEFDLGELYDLAPSSRRPIKEIRPLVFKITGDDGVCGATISFDQLRVKDSKESYSSDRTTRFVRDFVEGKIKGLVNDGAIKVGEPLTRIANIGSFNNLINGSSTTDTSWLDEGRKTPEPFGKCILDANVKTRNGEYEIMAFSPDGNDEDFENVVIRKKGEGMFKVAGLKYVDLNFMDKAYIGNTKIGVIELYKRNSQQKARIIDSELFEVLWQVTNDTRFNKAFPAELVSTNIRVYNDGVLSTIN